MPDFEKGPFGVPEALEAAAEPPLDFGHILDTYGLGPQEASAVISFGNYTGSVGAMLTDERCPVGGIVSDAYTADGISGVETKLEALKTLYGDFDLHVSHETRSYHEGTLDRSALFASVTPPEEPPSFLVL